MIVSVFSGLTSCSYNCCVKIVLLVFDSSLSRVILLMIPGHTADSYNCCFRNFGISKVETAKGVFMPEYGDFGMFFFGVVLVSVDDAFWSVFTIFDAYLTHLIYQE